MCNNFRQKFCFFNVLTINATNITEYLALNAGQVRRHRRKHS